MEPHADDTSLLLEVAALTEAQRRSMFALMRRFYAGVDRATFEADLREKQWVILIDDAASGRLGGFSTQVLVEQPFEGRTVRALFSGDTIIDPPLWGRNALAGAWGDLALRLIDRYGEEDLFWFLVSKGYKTYRFLPVFFHEFYPRSGVTAPVRVSRLVAALARRRFGARFDAAAGVVRAAADGCRLRAGVADVSDARLHDPHVRFFAGANPGHGRGDELCCLAPLRRDNFTAAGRRVLRRRPRLTSGA